MYGNLPGEFLKDSFRGETLLFKEQQSFRDEFSTGTFTLEGGILAIFEKQSVIKKTSFFSNRKQGATLKVKWTESILNVRKVAPSSSFALYVNV